jgi:hypothetical protein
MPRVRRIPDTAKWLPRSESRETLSEAYSKRCSFAEVDIVRRAFEERALNVDSFDAGEGIENLVRAKIASLFPKRYGFHPLTLTDRYGKSAGDVDIAVTNDHWFPEIKSGTTATARHVQFPIEGVYAVIEVKQTISLKTLDHAMEKLVTCSRLARPILGETRITENRTEALHAKYPLTLLHTSIVATAVDKNVEIDDLVRRFVRINQTMERQHVVRALTILGHATIMWAAEDNVLGGLRAADARSFDDVWYPAKTLAQSGEGALYPLIVDLYAHCNACVLPAEDIPAFYGQKTPHVKVALSPDLSHEPSRTWHSYHTPGEDGEPIFLTEDDVDAPNAAVEISKARRPRGESSQE